MALHDYFKQLICAVSEINGVLSIGKSGGDKLPLFNESDIDIFIFCDEIPTTMSRQSALMKLGTVISEMKLSETGGAFWGVCDFVTVADTEVCLMYFTIADMDNDINAVLSGSRLGREREYFYPTGRCATFVSMHILYDMNGYIAGMKEKLAVYPISLSKKLYAFHIGKINNTEDFYRAVEREDVLFYHSTLETALDHFLQALFAVNKCFFPSRKRSLRYIDNFEHKPQSCSEMLLKVIELGAKPETLRQSYEIWSDLCKRLSEISA